MLFERTAISKKPDKTIQQDLQLLREKKTLSSDLVFRDPYFLDFLGLSDTYSEKDLESSIIHEQLPPKEILQNKLHPAIKIA